MEVDGYEGVYGSYSVDCAGMCGGGAVEDECDICVGGNTGKTSCEPDCAGVWGGNGEVDDCNVCGGDGV